jgi:iron complex transport system substrate-binding protein
LLIAAAGCGDAGRRAASAPPDGTAADAPQRIVCGSPAVTEIVFALGCGDRVVGVSDYTTYPPEAVRKPSIGGFMNPSRERLLVLEPDVILTQGEHAALAGFAGEYGIRFLSVKLDTLDDLYRAVASIADAVGAADRGRELARRLQADLAGVRQQVAGAAPRGVLFLFARTPGDLTGLTTIGPGSFLDAVIRIAGGTNVFGDAHGAYPQVSKETLLVRRPEVILEVDPGGLTEDKARRLRADWQKLPELPAVVHGRIVYLDEPYLLVPGPRIGLAAARLARAIHPERAGE